MHTYTQCTHHTCAQVHRDAQRRHRINARKIHRVTAHIKFARTTQQTCTSASGTMHIARIAQMQAAHASHGPHTCTPCTQRIWANSALIEQVQQFLQCTQQYTNSAHIIHAHDVLNTAHTARKRTNRMHSSSTAHTTCIARQRKKCT